MANIINIYFTSRIKNERDIGNPRSQTVKTEDTNPSTTARRTADALSNSSVQNLIKCQEKM